MLRYFFLMLAVITSLFAGACLFGGGGEEEFELLEFEEVPPSPTSPVAQVVAEIGLDPAVVVQLRFLYGHQVRVGGLRRMGQDLRRLADYESPAAVDLSWVIEVHAVTEEMDNFAERAASAGIPESQRKQYQYLFVDLLEAIDVVGYGSLRLLEAATVIGPSGRSLETLEPADKERFLTLMGEASYFLTEGEELVDEASKDVGAAIGRVGLR